MWKVLLQMFEASGIDHRNQSTTTSVGWIVVEFRRQILIRFGEFTSFYRNKQMIPSLNYCELRNWRIFLQNG